MRLMVTIQHPAQVHFYRYAIEELEQAGHEVLVCTREKDVTTALLDAFDIPYRTLARTPDSLPRLAAMQVAYELRLLRLARRFRPHVMTSIGGIEISHVAPLVGARSVAFNDSEDTPGHRLITPFLDVVCTPRAFGGSLGARHRRYDGYHELAYLHPNRFDPDPDALRSLGVDPDEPYFVLRFIAWNAHHDVGHHGLSPSGKRELVSYLAERGQVYITSESELPREFEPYRLPVPPHRLHDLLYYAHLYVGDSQTMATEAAVLGTPAVRSNSFAGDADMSNFVELERRYGLLYSTADETEALERARALADDPAARDRFRRRRDRLLDEKIDVTSYVVGVLEAEGRKAGADAHVGPVRRRLRSVLPGGDPE